ncbi:SGNH/GDSL hydrolase family protein [Seohaeicola saemankumensis]|nr:SGNH/GDSL hydrolase family protein [Seohaeicola saemankumensis]MCA0873632.1 SGNH/GDSL hydrolase family protein [Seohaeicola saemankumensis]
MPLLPVLIGQALAVRSRAQLLPEPPGARIGTAGDGPVLRVLIAGDSSAAGVGAETQQAALSGQLAARLSRHHALRWRLEAVTGATTRSTLARLRALEPERFDVAVIALGVNDVTRAVPVRVWTARQRQLHALLRARFGVTRIIASGLPPMAQFPLLPDPLAWVLGCHAARLDAALAGLAADDPALEHVPLSLPFAPEYVARDGFHPSALAYDHWAGMLAGRFLQGDVLKD